MYNAVVLALTATAVVDGAGMTSHNVIARRTLDFMTNDIGTEGLAELAKARTDAIHAGAPYPDFLYACGDEHDAGEATHWSPFQMAGATYIREHYPDWQTQAPDEDGPGLVAFFLGLVSHYIADLNWHGLEVVPDGEGLIRQMGIADFNCTGDLCDTAHHTCDAGGEFMAAHMMDLGWYPNQSWYVPVDDLIGIYALANESGWLQPSFPDPVKPAWIEECSIAFHVGSWAVATFGDLFYPYFEKTSPFLAENYVTFPVGGIEDDAAWTQWMWERFGSWLEDGPPPTPPQSDLIAFQNRPPPEQRRAWLKTVVDAVKPLAISSYNDGSLPLEISRSSNGGISLTLDAEALATDHEFARLLGEALVAPFEAGNYPTATAWTEGELAEMAHSIRDGVHRRATQLASGTDAAEALVEAAVEGETTLVAQGSQNHELMGSVASGSLNAADGDDSNDIVIGSPGWDAGVGAPMTGKVEIRFATGGSAVVEGDPALSSNFGASVAVLDMDLDGHADLVVGAPNAGRKNVTAVVGNYTGLVYVFRGPFSDGDHVQVAGGDSDAVDTHGMLRVEGGMTWGSFGTSLTTADCDGDGHLDLLVSSPYAGNASDAIKSQGRLHVFLADADVPSSVSVEAEDFADLVAGSARNFEWFGSAAAVAVDAATGSRVLAVGAPISHVDEDAGAVGRVYGFNLTTALGSDVEKPVVLSAQADAIFSVIGDEQSQKLGFALAFGTVDGATMLAISSPSKTVKEGLLHLRTAHHAGQIVVLPLGSLPTGQETSIADLEAANGAAVVAGASNFARLGWKMEFADMDQDGSDELIASAPMESCSDLSLGRLGANCGRVNAYRYTSKLLGGGFELKLVDSARGAEPIARFGSDFSIVSATDGGLAIVGTAPLSKGAHEMTGAVLSAELRA